MWSSLEGTSFSFYALATDGSGSDGSDAAAAALPSLFQSSAHLFMRSLVLRPDSLSSFIFLDTKRLNAVGGLDLRSFLTIVILLNFSRAAIALSSLFFLMRSMMSLIVDTRCLFLGVSMGTSATVFSVGTVTGSTTASATIFGASTDFFGRAIYVEYMLLNLYIGSMKECAKTVIKKV